MQDNTVLAPTCGQKWLRPQERTTNLSTFQHQRKNRQEISLKTRELSTAIFGWHILYSLFTRLDMVIITMGPVQVTQLAWTDNSAQKASLKMSIFVGLK